MEVTVIMGELDSDGTLRLMEKPCLRAGLVEVTIRAISPVTGEDWWGVLQRCRRELEAENYQFRTKAEIDASVCRDW
jgi:hypothetical protein